MDSAVVVKAICYGGCLGCLVLWGLHYTMTPAKTTLERVGLAAEEAVEDTFAAVSMAVTTVQVFHRPEVLYMFPFATSAVFFHVRAHKFVSCLSHYRLTIGGNV